MPDVRNRTAPPPAASPGGGKQNVLRPSPGSAPTLNEVRPFGRAEWWTAALIVLATLLVHAPDLWHGFLDWDDWSNIGQNPRLNPPTLSGLATYWTRLNPHEEFYVPINYTVWWLLAHVARGDGATGNAALTPGAFHAFNLAVHALNGVLVLVVLRRLSSWLPAAALGALMFTLHPVQVEPVAWVSSMYSGLSGMFSLLAAWQFLVFSDGRHRQDRADPATPRRAVWPHYAAATLAFAAAILTKPNVVTLPIVVGAIAWGVRGRRLRELVLPLCAWLALAAPIILLAKVSQADAPVHPVPLQWRPVIALDALSFYLRKLVFPIGLSPDYGRSPQWLLGGARGKLYFTWILPAALLGVCAAFWRRSRRPLACLMVFVAAVLPALGLVPFDYQRFSTVADRYIYLAMLGPALALALALSRRRATPLAAAAGVMVAVFAVLSHRQTYHWRDTNTLFTQALRVNPGSLAAHSVFGYRFAAAGADEQAMAEYALALEANPGDPRVLFNVGNLKLRRGQFAEAEAAYRQALPLMSGHSTLQSNLGVTLAQLGRREEALSALREAVRINPANADARANLGVVLASGGDLADARHHFQAALQLAPNHAAARRGLAKLQSAAN